MLGNRTTSRLTALDGARLLIVKQRALIDNYKALDQANLKAIAVLEEENKRLRDKLKTNAPKILAAPARIQLKRNKSWRRSAFLGVREALWMAPTALVESVGIPLLALLIGAATAVGGLIVWAVQRLLLLAAGAVGYLEDSK